MIHSYASKYVSTAQPTPPLSHHFQPVFPLVTLSTCSPPSPTYSIATPPRFPTPLLKFIAPLPRLNFLHLQGIIHQDLKPANLLLGENGIVKICDFGVSHAIVDYSTHIMVDAGGTPPFMSPEAHNGKVGKAGDVWSVGVIIYTLLIGHLPFWGSNLTDLVEQIEGHDPMPSVQTWVHERLERSEKTATRRLRCVSDIGSLGGSSTDDGGGGDEQDKETGDGVVKEDEGGGGKEGDDGDGGAGGADENDGNSSMAKVAATVAIGQKLAMKARAKERRTPRVMTHQESRSDRDITFGGNDEAGEGEKGDGVSHIRQQVLRQDLISRAITMPESPVLVAAVEEQLDLERELYEDALSLVESMLLKIPRKRIPLTSVIQHDFISQRGRYPLTFRRESVVTISQRDISSAVTEVTRLSTVIKIKTQFRKYLLASRATLAITQVSSKIAELSAMQQNAQSALESKHEGSKRQSRSSTGSPASMPSEPSSSDDKDQLNVRPPPPLIPTKRKSINELLGRDQALDTLQSYDSFFGSGSEDGVDTTGSPKSKVVSKVGELREMVVHHTVDPMLQARRQSGLLRTHDRLELAGHDKLDSIQGGEGGESGSDSSDDDGSVEALDQNGMEDLLDTMASSNNTDPNDERRAHADSMMSTSTSGGHYFTWSQETISLIHRLVAGESGESGGSTTTTVKPHTPSAEANAEANAESNAEANAKENEADSDLDWDIPWMNRGGSDARVHVASASGTGKQKYQEDRFVSLARATRATEMPVSLTRAEKMAAQAAKMASRMNGVDPSSSSITTPASTTIPSDRLRRCTKTQAHHQASTKLDVNVNVNAKTTMEEDVALGLSHDPLKDVGYFAVYDGHSGHKCSDFVQNNLHDCLLGQPGFDAIVRRIAAENSAATQGDGAPKDGAPVAALSNPRSDALEAMAGLLEKAFEETDKRFLEMAMGTDPNIRPLHSDGSTAVVALTIPCREAPRRKLRQRPVNMIEHRLTEESIRRLSERLSEQSNAEENGQGDGGAPEGSPATVNLSPHKQAQRQLATRLLNGDGGGGGRGGTGDPTVRLGDAFRSRHQRRVDPKQKGNASHAFISSVFGRSGEAFAEGRKGGEEGAAAG